jgi:ABC-type microcin C transport system permease subunit YejE
MVALGEIGQRRLRTFKANQRGYWSLWIFSTLFLVTLFADVVSNDKPLLIRYDGGFYFPVLYAYPETSFDGFFETEADYSDPEVQELIEAKGWILWPLIPFSFDTICYDAKRPALARDRRPGAGCRRPPDLRFSHLGAFRIGVDRDQFGDRHRGWRGSGLLRRKN